MSPPFENSLFIVYDDSRDPGVKFNSQLAKCWVHWLGHAMAGALRLIGVEIFR